MAKRGRDLSDDNQYSQSDSDGASTPFEPRRKVLRRTLSHVHITGPAYPLSAYEGYEPPLDVSTEGEALRGLQAAYANHQWPIEEDIPEYKYFTLDDFSIYRPQNPHHAHELVGLDRLQNRDGFSEFLFDGILSFGMHRYYVQGVRFSILTIDGYGDLDFVDVHDRIDIKSSKAGAEDVWYKLGKPSQEYCRFYEPFVWLVQFTKHFIDYLLDNEAATLNDFRFDFYYWLNAKYRHEPGFQLWHNQCRRLQDFRTTIAAHVGFLWKECSGIHDDEPTQPIWGEVHPSGLNAIHEQPKYENWTIVTPFVFKCFENMYFREHMEVRHVGDQDVIDRITAQKKAMKLTPFNATTQAEQAPDNGMLTPNSLPNDDSTVAAGDFVRVHADSEGPWKATALSLTWYAYVQDVREVQNKTKLDVIWLYEPCDTTLGKAFYPFPNELFMSDNCDCGSHAIDINCVIGKADVTCFAENPSKESGLFIRQKFRTVQEDDCYDFVSLRESDFTCWHATKNVGMFEECRQKYQTGDTVLVREYNRNIGEDALEPAQVVEFNLDSQSAVLRRLGRKASQDPAARPNELVLTKELFNKPPSTIVRKCHVRYFDPEVVEEGLPVPYNCGGAGDFYFIVGDESNQNTDAETGLEPLERGIYLTEPSAFPKLQGIGLFCGGGNFDRGLEDSGAVKFRYAVEWDQLAIHSYRANVEDPDKVRFFWGSVNDYLAQAIAGADSDFIAKFIDLLLAGSPCPGFSQLQRDKGSFDSLRNASMVASVVSFVDLYSPKYCILENVVSMTHGMGANKDENVFAQILAALVALGYQVQQFHMDAWSFGESTSRSRVFIVASAPGLEPLPQPPHTHDHVPGQKMFKTSLGKSSNGLPFGSRREYCTPFQHVSPRESTRDLPIIGDSQPQLCPAFPDHRTPSEQSDNSRTRIAVVPIDPPGMGLVQAVQAGKVKGQPLEYYNSLNSIGRNPKSTTYSRVHGDRLFPTVTTVLRIACGFAGNTLHWEENRLLTVLELRRAQGYPDNEVILGNPPQQIKIIGNSVARKVAFCLGLSLRESWAKSAHGFRDVERLLKTLRTTRKRRRRSEHIN